MSENNNNKNHNGQGFKKKYNHHRKWHNHKHQNKKENLVTYEEEDVLEAEVIESVDVLTETEFVEDVEVKDVVEDTEITQESSDDLSSPKKIVKDIEDEKEDFNKPDDNDDYFIKIDWPLHDDMKKKLTPDFHRGCCIKAENYSVGSNVLRHNQCKLDSFNWLKDYQELPSQGELLVAEVRFKNDRKDFCLQCFILFTIKALSRT
jgi:hypothetical protein